MLCYLCYCHLFLVTVQPQVSSASVNLATETAIVWAIPESKVMPNWKQQLGARLAGNLTTCGFKSSFRGTFPLRHQFGKSYQID